RVEDLERSVPGWLGLNRGRPHPDDPGGWLGRFVEDLPAFGLVQSAHRRPEELAHQTERELALELGAAAGEDLHSGPFGSLRRFLQQPALPDARLALDDDQPPVTASGVRESGLELIQLPIALQERGLRASRHLSLFPNEVRGRY